MKNFKKNKNLNIEKALTEFVFINSLKAFVFYTCLYSQYFPAFYKLIRTTKTNKLKWEEPVMDFYDWIEELYKKSGEAR